MRKAIIAIGLGFGDEGKGSIVDWLVRRHDAEMVVRFNGGAQAAHHVVTSDGREHTFAQFGSGTFHPGCLTHLSEHVLVNPLNLAREYEHLAELGELDALDRLTIHEDAVIITPFHVALNRAEEVARGWKRHGTTGQGVGVARRDQLGGKNAVLYARDLRDARKMLAKLLKIQFEKLAEIDQLGTDLDIEKLRADLPLGLTRAYQRIAPRIVEAMPEIEGTAVFEGAQGVLLDETFGFYPHNTWTDTTATNARALLQTSGFEGDLTTIGIIRSYMTRHGAGPFPTEDRRLSKQLPERDAGGWAGQFRVGYPDLMLLDYALQLCPVDGLAVTCMDRLAEVRKSDWKICVGHEAGGSRIAQVRGPSAPTSSLAAKVLARSWPVLEPLGRTVNAYRSALPTSVVVWSKGPTANDKEEPK